MLTLNLDGLHLTEQRLAAIRAGLVDLQPLFEKLGDLAETQSKHRIEELKTGPDGVRWPEWSDRYQAAVIRSGNASHRQLDKTGDLLDSLTRFADRHGGGVSANLQYAHIHQFGGKAGMRPGPAAIPARPYLGFSDDNLAEIRAVCNDYLDALLGGEA